MQRTGRGGRREQSAGRQVKPCTGSAPCPQNSLAEKLLLEQSIARVVGGQTGLLMYLDMLLHDAEEKDSEGFLCHAEGYLRRMEKLEPLYARYQGAGGQGTESALYGSLLKVGKNLRRKLPEIPPEGLSDKELDTWRRSVLRHIDLYGGRGSSESSSAESSSAGNSGPDEGYAESGGPGEGYGCRGTSGV